MGLAVRNVWALAVRRPWGSDAKQFKRARRRADLVGSDPQILSGR